MEEIDDFAAFICYNMILSSLPVDQRGRGDFGEYLRADENIVRRLLNALSGSAQPKLGTTALVLKPSAAPSLPAAPTNATSTHSWSAGINT